MAANNAVMPMVQRAVTFLSGHLRAQGDSRVSGGTFYWEGTNGLSILAWNADNHQITYGVLRSALMVLEDYMVKVTGPGTAEFTIWDGYRQVGQGVLRWKD